MNFGGVYGSDATIWYPASGFLSYYNGALSGVGQFGYYWSVTLDSSKDAYCLYIRKAGDVFVSIGYGRSDGNAVRCLQE